MLFQKRIDGPGERTDLPTSKIGDDVFRAVRHQETDDVSFRNSVRGQQTSSRFDGFCELRVRKLPAVSFREQKNLIGRSSYTRFK